MTELLDRAIAQVRTLPDADQDMFASVLLSALAPGEAAPLDVATRAAIREGVTQARCGELASDEDVAALWNRHGL